MTLKELREEAWSAGRETGTDDNSRYWSKAEMNRYINKAYFRIARETKCIRDSITPSICRILVAPPTDEADLILKAATDSWYAQDLSWYNDPTSWLHSSLVAPYSFPLSPAILSIDEVKWATTGWRLTKVSVTKWQDNVFWEQVKGIPTEYCTDLDSNRIALNFRSETSDTLKLSVRRMPLSKLVDDTSVPEIKESYQEYLLEGILAQMYAKQDIETFNVTKVRENEAIFVKNMDDIKNKEVLINDRLSINHSLSAFR